MRSPTLLLLALLSLFASGCGDEEATDVATSPDGTEGTEMGAEGVVADLEITVTEAGSDDPGRTALLECTETTSTGNLWLEGDAAEEACQALADPAVRAALEPPPADQVCAEVYGGPSVATIVGTVDGEQVDAVVDRSDGCAIERWDVLSALLPEPIGV